MGRKQKDFKEFENSIDLSIKTKCPSKWLLIDRETGQVYQGTDKGYWDRLDPVIRQNKSEN
jgi:hypothetical protein